MCLQELPGGPVVSGTFTTVAQVQYLLGELKSGKLQGAAKKMCLQCCISMVSQSTWGNTFAYFCKMKCRKDKQETNGIGYLKRKERNEQKRYRKQWNYSDYIFDF